MLVPIGSNNSALGKQENGWKFRGVKKISAGEASPEKAGVGGSIPSLATMFSMTYSHSKMWFHSVSFQKFRSTETRLTDETRTEFYRLSVPPFFRERLCPARKVLKAVSDTSSFAGGSVLGGPDHVGRNEAFQLTDSCQNHARGMRLPNTAARGRFPLRDSQ
jgi:hypothetical protein